MENVLKSRFSNFLKLNFSIIKRGRVDKNKILIKFLFCLYMATSTAVMHNSNMLVALHGERPFLTRRPGSAGGSAPYPLSGIQASEASLTCSTCHGRRKGA